MSDVTEGEEKYALDVYTLLRVTQAQHGLKHGDYERYRKYCSRRLLRLYKSLKFVHGKGGKFEKRSLSVEEVKEARYFLIPLMNAERCWSSAMAVKKEIENSKKWVTHRKHHMFKKLKRATTWADEFTSLCSAKGDSRTATEAEAYALFMKGMYLLERGDSNALTAFLQTRSLYEKLGRGGSNEDSATFLELQSEIEPIILFCKYQMKKQAGTNKASDLEQLKDVEMSAHLKAEFESLVSSEEQGFKVKEITWRNKTLEIPSARLVNPTSDVFAQMNKMEEDGEKILEKRLEAYGSLFAKFDNIKQAVHSEKSDVAGGGASAMSSESKDTKRKLEQFERAIRGLMLESQVKRNLELIEARWTEYVPANKGRKAANTSPEEMYRLYEHLKLDVFDLSELASNPNDEDEALYDECSTAMSAIKTLLCFFLGEQHNSLQKDKESYLLYNRAVEYSDMLEDNTKLANSLFAPVLEAAEKASNLSRIGRCVTHAKACAAVSTVEGDGAAQESDTTNISLMENLGDAQAFVGAQGRQVYRMPPALKTLPCQPFLLDTAIDHIEYPQIGDKGAAGGRARGTSILGGVSSMFGWGGKSS